MELWDEAGYGMPLAELSILVTGGCARISRNHHCAQRNGAWEAAAQLHCWTMSAHGDSNWRSVRRVRGKRSHPSSVIRY